jgi:hypothetical protein
MRGRTCELRSRKGRGGQQHEAKICHDKLKSPEKFLNNKQGACWPNVSALAINS